MADAISLGELTWERLDEELGEKWMLSAVGGGEAAGAFRTRVMELYTILMEHAMCSRHPV